MDAPLRNPSELVRPLRGNVYPVTSAKVLVADYELLRKDFPALRALPEAEIDSWLIQNGGWMTAQQVDYPNPRLSDPIPVEKSRLAEGRAIRPEGYGRALVHEVEGGLLDVKGAGSLAPRPGGHTSGLMSSGEALKEFLFEKKVQEIFHHAGLEQPTVGTYAVIDWGFDLVERDGKTKNPAGAVIRQAHARKPGSEIRRPNIFMDDARAAELERVLRTYGVISSGERWGAGVEAVNIQASREGALVDFGAFQVRAGFYNPIYRYEDAALLSDKPNHPGRKEIKPLLRPGTPGYPVLDREMALPTDSWGNGRMLPPHDKYDLLSHRGNRLVAGWRKGEKTLDEVREFVQSTLGSRKFPESKAGWYGRPGAACANAFSGLRP
jgi:hypothetical protein